MATAKQPKAGARHVNKRPLTRDDNEKVVDHLLAPGATPPLVLAILGQAILEYRLDFLLRSRLSRKDDETWWTMVQEGGPFSTFSAKIKAAYALKFIDDNDKRNMEVVRVVRNAFAHSQKLLTFDDDDIIAELRKIKEPKKRAKRYTELHNAKIIRHNGETSYFTLCFSLYFMLGERELHRSKARTRYLERRNKALKHFSAGNPFGAVLWDLGGPIQRSSPGGGQADYASRLFGLLSTPVSPPEPTKKD